ncbi:MAG: 23S rRNA (pseudouridine(1915)-N(3))-methyltransferase RlmH [Gemmatimonadetes bacterium]|nr:23S rRNA (pseudouridine(1915)-N(3))-methyltransferase RlmH [Gemmatimonadota bacterium]
MRVTIVAVGHPRSAPFAAAAADYEARAARYWPLHVVEVREAKLASPSLTAEREGERILAAVPRGAHLVACDERGRGMKSTDFAKWLQRHRERAQDICIVLGGANGLSPAVLSQARESLSLAPWTLPHELARVVLAEQLYRAGTIQRGEPYHK